MVTLSKYRLKKYHNIYSERKGPGAKKKMLDKTPDLKLSMLSKILADDILKYYSCFLLSENRLSHFMQIIS